MRPRGERAAETGYRKFLLPAHAIVKWDGPDQLYYNLPDKFERIHLDKGGIRIAKDAQEVEFCLAYACNHLAKDCWNRST